MSIYLCTRIWECEVVVHIFTKLLFWDWSFSRKVMFWQKHKHFHVFMALENKKKPATRKVFSEKTQLTTLWMFSFLCLVACSLSLLLFVYTEGQITLLQILRYPFDVVKKKSNLMWRDSHRSEEQAKINLKKNK